MHERKDFRKCKRGGGGGGGGKYLGCLPEGSVVIQKWVWGHSPYTKRQEVNKNNILGAQFLIFLSKNPGK